MHARRGLALALSAAAVLGMTACAAGGSDATGDIVIQHAYGETVIDGAPERVATLGWGSQDVVLDLGVVPVGMERQTWGVADGSGILPWAAEQLAELGGETPVLFDNTDGIDFEAVADTAPDVIIATYSGITQEEYTTLSEIAPVVAFPGQAWATPWRDMTTITASALGMPAEGEALVAETEQLMAEGVAARPGLAERNASFTFISTADGGSSGYYTTQDPRAGLLGDLGFGVPGSVETSSAGATSFYVDVSPENIDTMNDIDVAVMYLDEAGYAAVKADPLLGTMRAVQNDAVVLVGGEESALSSAINPSPMSIRWGLDEYLDLLATASAKVK